MTEKGNQVGATNLPLGRIFRLKDLPGWLGKRFRVPSDRLGVAIFSNGTVRTFPPGEHRILSALQRLQGKGFGLQVGFIPEKEFIALFKLEYLLSGDRELLDARLVCTIEIAEPVRFFSEIVVPRGEIRNTGVELDPQFLQDALGAVTTHYAASDLAYGRIDERLVAQIQASLGVLLAGQGMHLKEICLLTLSRSENRALVAEKAQMLTERLSDVEVQAKMAGIENQAQLDEFIQQIDPGLQQVAHLGVSTNIKMESTGSPKGQLARAVRTWLGIESGQGEKKRSWRLENLFQQRQTAREQASRKKSHRPPSRWWLPRVSWIVFVCIVAYLLIRLVEWNAGNANLADRLSIHLVVWGFVVTVILESIKALYEKSEKIADESWSLHGYQHLDKLVGNDRKWADDIVREQCAREMLHIRDVVSKIREMEYKRGRTELALKLRNELERNATDCAEKVQQREYGQPPYVTSLRVSQYAWLQMLDIDEDLLLYVHGISDKANLLQQKAHSGELTDEMTAELDADILEFSNRFFERGRPLRIPDSENEKKELR